MGQYFKAVLRNDRVKEEHSMQRFIDFLEDNNIHTYIGEWDDNEKYIECEYYSNAGEDFIFTLAGKNNIELAKNLNDFYEDFDADEHAVENYGSKGAPSSLRTLLDDAEDIDSFLKELSEKAISEFEGDTGNLIILRADGGSKLTEHSWLGNWLTDTVSEMIYRNPMRISWVGDYTDEKFETYISDESICKTNDIPELDEIWGHCGTQGKKVNEINPFDYTDKYIINHTLGLYIDLNKYREKSKTVEEYGDGKEYEMTLYPISLLCCTNNGSGGSYYGVNENQCEKWNWCEISIEDELPNENLKEWNYWFKE